MKCLRKGARVALVVLLAQGTAAWSQNLVPNPGFEEFEDCSTGTDWTVVAEWLIPPCTFDPEYFHACANAIGPCYGVPCNGYGFQYAHAGDGYAGVATYLRHSSNHHQKVTAALIAPLAPGALYCVQVHINLADISSMRSNTLQGLFTVVMPSACAGGDSLWATTAQLSFATDMVDTISWFLLEGEYTAMGGEAYFTFGNFLPDSLSDASPVGPGPEYDACLFWIDDVYVGSCDVAVEESAAPEELSIYPNPATDRIVIGGSSLPANATLIVGDALGREVMHVALPANCVLQIGALLPGTYHLRVLNAHDMPLRWGRFVIE